MNLSRWICKAHSVGDWPDESEAMPRYWGDDDDNGSGDDIIVPQGHNFIGSSDRLLVILS